MVGVKIRSFDIKIIKILASNICNK